MHWTEALPPKEHLAEHVMLTPMPAHDDGQVPFVRVSGGRLGHVWPEWNEQTHQDTTNSVSVSQMYN